MRPRYLSAAVRPRTGLNCLRVNCLLIVEDDRLLRDSLVADVRASAEDWHVLAADSIATAQALLLAHTPDAVFLDLGLPDGDGFGLIRRIRQRHPACEVLVITVFADEQRVLRSLEAGASGYILKTDLPQFSGRLLSTIVAGGSPISPAIARRLIERLRPSTPQARAGQGPEPLSQREAEILGLCAKGLRYAEIAGALGLSVHTVNAHLKSVYRKLMVNSRGEAVFEARRAGLLDG
jgi:DNA-binding NarL/FixJ family response regulator